MNKLVNIKLEIEPEKLSLYNHMETCPVLEASVEVNYDGEELQEDFRTLKVFDGGRDITGKLTLLDYEYVTSLVVKHVTYYASNLIADFDADEFLYRRAERY